MFSSVFAPGTVPYDRGPLVSDSRGEGTARCSCKPKLLCFKHGLWNTILSMIKQVSKGKFRLEGNSSCVGPSTLASCTAVTHSLVKAITGMTQVRVQDDSSCKKNRRQPMGAYSLVAIMLPPSNSVSSMDTKSGGFVFRTKSRI
jgi:hypothetical protein